MTPELPGTPELSGLVARVRSLWRGALRRGDIEAEMTEEFRHHLELRTEELVRRGLPREEATRQARIEFGHIESHKGDARASRGLRVFDEIRFSWLDVKLGARMLVRYPGLTIVGGLAMAFGIFVGAGTFHFIDQHLDPTLPLPAGERVIGLRYWDRAENQESVPIAHDLLTWRAELRTVQDVGAFETIERNLAVGRETGEPARIARMSPSGFRVAGIAPLFGRTLTDADAEPGAFPVVVVGHRLWQTRLGGDPAAVGRTVRLGEIEATVVGVMPEGYAFPRDHLLWVPLRVDEASANPEAGAPVRVFGRLAPGANIAEARTEVSNVAARTARDAPKRFEHLQAEVLPYVESLSSLKLSAGIRAMLYQANVFAVLFLVLVSANVALLMFARTATREREIVVRIALGASRGRIVMQLFIEALVLASLATVLGLAATGPALRWVAGILEEIGGVMPFWFDPDVSRSTALYAGLLVLVSAVVTGVVPALKATGRGMRARLNQVGAGAGGLRLGGIWTAIVVTQIAATVIFTGVAFMIARQAARSASVETYFPAEQYLGARIELDRESAAAGSDTSRAAFLRSYATHVRELERRISEHPGVIGVTLAEQLPVKAHASAFIEVDETGAAPPDPARPRHESFSGAVDLDFFDVMRAPLVAGRGFDARDLAAGSNAVVVTASFVEDILGGRSAIGRRIRYVGSDPGAEPGPWHEVVGVVRDLVADRTRSLDLEDPLRARIYRPQDALSAGSYPLHLVAHVRGNPGELAPVLHQMAERISPALQVHEPLTLDLANSDLARLWQLYADMIMTVSVLALFLSLAGIYAVMSFTVARRTREIGVRVALGAWPTRVVAEVFRKPLVQIAIGVAVGCVLVAALVWALTSGRATVRDAGLLVVLGLGIVGVCGLACIGPTIRALKVEPAEALRAES